MNPPSRRRQGSRAWLLCLSCLALLPALAQAGPILFKHGDTVAFIGGADVVALIHTGHLETALTAAHPEAAPKFRNFGWAGDTVFERPRDFGFPPLKEHLEKAGADVLFAFFGRTEALDATRTPAEFVQAYETLIADLSPVVPRIILVTPPPFENPGQLLPNLAEKNPRLAEYAAAIRDLAQRKHLACVDLFEAFPRSAGERFTQNGLHLTPRGHAILAKVFLGQTSGGAPPVRIPRTDPDGVYADPGWEALRQLIISKNRLWFNFWRPQNWAFLGGDRTAQPSSRDHLNPEIRWFPAEMQEFMPLIQHRESEIAAHAIQIAGGAQ